MALEKVLVVDDDPKACSNMKRFLGEKDMTVEIANSVDVALAKVEEFNPECVLLDIRLPKVNGVECLKTLRKHKPDLPVFMVTAIAHDELEQGCLKAGARGYIKKPVDFEILYSKVKEAIQSSPDNGAGPVNQDQSLNADDIVDDVVASPPTIYHQLQDAINDPHSSFTDFEKIIINDPSLSARLLKIVNSPFYGFSSKVSTISHALNIVGTDQLADMALATGVLSQFKGIPKEILNMESFWKHSIAVGLGARIIAKHLQVPEVERFYLAGMLHDLGSLILYKEAADKMTSIIGLARASERPLYELEQENLGFTHAEVGKNLMKRWDLPASLIESVAYHHNPLEAPKNKQQALAVYVADVLAYRLKLGSSGETHAPEIGEDILEGLNMDQETLDQVEEEMAREFVQVADMFL